MKQSVLMAGGMAVALSLAGYYVSQLRSWPIIDATAVSPHRRPPPSSCDAGMAEGNRVTGGGGGLPLVSRHGGMSPNFTSALITSSVVGVPQSLIVHRLADFDELGDTPNGYGPLVMEKEICDMKKVMIELRNSVTALQEREQMLELDGLKEQEAVLTLRELKNGIKITDMEILDMKQEIAELRGVVLTLHEQGRQVEFDDLKDQEAASALRGIRNGMEIANMEAIGMKQEIAEIKSYVQALPEGNHKTEYDDSFKDQVAVMKELESDMKITYVQVLNMKQELEICGCKVQEAVERELGNNNTKIDEMKQDIITKLRDMMVQTLQEMDRFKEQEMIIRELEKHVKVSGIEVLEMKRESAELGSSVRICLEEMKKKEKLEYDILQQLEAVLKELTNKAQVAEFEALGMKQLEIAELQDSMRKLQECNRKFEFQVLESNNLKEQESMEKKIAALQKKIVKLRNDKGGMMKRARDMEKDLSKLKDEAAQLTSENSRLAQRNCELSKKLESAEMLLSTNSVNVEANDAVEEVDRLRQTNEDLQKKIDQLQTDQCSELQQQVYLRWINACLRYELRNHQPPRGKLVAKDLNHGLSPTSAEKAKELIFEYAYSDKEESLTDTDLENWLSSQSSSQVEIEIQEPDDDGFSACTKDDKRRSVGKSKLLSKLKKLVRKKEGKASSSVESVHHHRRSSDAAKIIIGGGRCKSDLGGCNGRFVRNEATWNGGSPLLRHGRDQEETPEKTRLKKYAIALKTST